MCDSSHPSVHRKPACPRVKPVRPIPFPRPRIPRDTCSTMDCKKYFHFSMHASLLAVLLLFPALMNAQSASDAGWPNYGNDPGGTRYSTAKQIDRGNVARLQVAWTYRTGALPNDEDLDKKAAFEATPILIDGKLFLSTPYDHVIALNAVTGAKLW